MGIVLLDILYYQYKYNLKARFFISFTIIDVCCLQGWQALTGVDTIFLPTYVADELQVRKDQPGLVETVC